MRIKTKFRLSVECLVQNTAIQIDILMLSWIATRLHQDTGRFGAAGLGKGGADSLKRLGQCFFLNSRKYRKNSGLQRGFCKPHPLGCPGLLNRQNCIFWDQWDALARSSLVDLSQNSTANLGANLNLCFPSNLQNIASCFLKITMQ